MISYKPFFDLIKKRDITQYRLIKDYDISTSLLDKLKHDKGLRLTTINDICVKLDCKIEEVVEIILEDASNVIPTQR